MPQHRRRRMPGSGNIHPRPLPVRQNFGDRLKDQIVIVN
jgi:hypothetical protein